MKFSELVSGDTFDCVYDGDDLHFIKTDILIYQSEDESDCVNGVCIDQYSEHKGDVFWFQQGEEVGHVNWG